MPPSRIIGNIGFTAVREQKVWRLEFSSRDCESNIRQLQRDDIDQSKFEKTLTLGETNFNIVFYCELVKKKQTEKTTSESITGLNIMSSVTNTFENVKAIILSAHKSTTSRDKVNFYNSWAQNYDQDVAVLDYRAPIMAANSISSHFSGNREAAAVLDVACGTGQVAKQMKRHGFGHFVGIDGSKAMLELARESGLYQDLKLCLLGEEPLPVQWGVFDVVVIIGALSVGQVPVDAVRELCKSSKPGGYICMTTRSNRDNMEYKAALDRELKLMEEEDLWTCVEVTEVEEWERAVSEHEEGYIPGTVYLYKKQQI